MGDCQHKSESRHTLWVSGKLVKDVMQCDDCGHERPVRPAPCRDVKDAYTYLTMAAALLGQDEPEISRVLKAERLKLAGRYLLEGKS